MTAPRSTRLEHSYQRHRRKERSREVESGCTFCRISETDYQYVEQTESLKVIRNIAPYSVWDGQGVSDHLLIIPKKHTEKLGDLDASAAAEFIQLVDKYEALGYNLFARAPLSKTRASLISTLI